MAYDAIRQSGNRLGACRLVPDCFRGGGWPLTARPGSARQLAPGGSQPPMFAGLVVSSPEGPPEAFQTLPLCPGFWWECRVVWGEDGVLLVGGTGDGIQFGAMTEGGQSFFPVLTSEQEEIDQAMGYCPVLGFWWECRVVWGGDGVLLVGGTGDGIQFGAMTEGGQSFFPVPKSQTAVTAGSLVSP